MADALGNTVDKTTFRECMSRHGVSVSVIATQFKDQSFGFSATAVCSVSDDPPTLLVCLNRSSSCYDAFNCASHFSVNLLLPGQENIANTFGGAKPHIERFEHGKWVRGTTGVPVLAQASVSFECERTRSVDEASHTILIGRVINMKANSERGALLYYRREYLSL